jgi:hypothetical protein
MEQFQSIMGRKYCEMWKMLKIPLGRMDRRLRKEQQCNTERGSGEQLEDPKDDGLIGTMTLDMPLTT